MASTINASTSAGIIQTADTSGVLALQTGGTTALTINTTGSVAFGTSASAYGTSGQILTSNGNAVPTWQAPPASMIYPGAGVAVSNGSAWGTSLAAASANTANALVQRDGSGNFSAGTITAALSGNASTATSATSASTSTTQAKSNASTNIATTAFAKQLFYSPSTGGTLDWNDVSNTRPGAGETLLLGSATNGPGGGNYYIPFNYEYASFDGTGNVTQMAIAYGTPANELWMRGRYVGTWSSWVRYLNSSNFTTYVPLVNNTFTTYGGAAQNIAKAGYYGVLLGNATTHLNVMADSSGNGGFYRESSGTWPFYYLVANAGVGIMTSTTSASYALYVAGSIYATANVTAYSDRRAKKDIVTIDNALEKTNKLRGVYYKKIEEDIKDEAHHDKRQMGVIAQEVLEIAPEVVTYDKENDKYGVAYANMAGLFIEAIKELTDKVATLEAKLEQLTKDKS